MNETTVKESLEKEKLELEIKALQRNPLKKLLAMLPLASTLIAVAALLIGVNQFSVSQRTDSIARNEELAADRTARRELAEQNYRREFWNVRRNAYQKVVNITGEMASLDPGEKRKELELKFWALFWGEMSLLEDKHVYDAMKKFAEKIQDSDANRIELQKESFALAWACRRSLNATWDSVSLHQGEFDTNPPFTK